MTTTESGGVVASYLLLRKAIGWIGTLLPVVLVAGDAAFSSGPLPNSISGYYYTPMRNILVGTLCVFGVFLLIYDVGVFSHRWFTNMAGVGVLGVAFFPGSPAITNLTTTEEVIGNVHVVFAGVAFVGFLLTTWCFSRADSDGPDAPAPSRDAVIFYRACAGVMLVFEFASGAANFLSLSVQNATFVLFISEALVIITFGIAFLIKGGGLQPLLSAPGMTLTRSPGQGAGSAAAQGELPR
jgi:hypothetical protein